MAGEFSTGREPSAVLGGRPSRRRPIKALGVALSFLFPIVSARGQTCDVNLLCTGDPCVISGNRTLTNPCTLNFQQRRVEILNAAVVQSAEQFGNITLFAGDLTVRGQLTTQGGVIRIKLAGNGTSSQGRLTTDGAGRILANHSGDDGGMVIITTDSGGMVTVAGTSAIRANGQGTVDVCIGYRNPDDLCEIPGTGAITISSVPGSGAAISADHGGMVALTGGPIDLQNNAKIDVSNTAQTDDGGGVALLANNGGLTVSGTIVASDIAAFGDGGDISLEVRGNRQVSVSNTGTIRAEGNANNGGDGYVTIGTACVIEVKGIVDTLNRGDGVNDLRYRGNLIVRSTGRLLAGPQGENDATCRATYSVGSCEAQPIVESGATVSPALTVFNDFTMGPCVGCGNGVREGNELCDDGNATICDGCSPSCTVQVVGNACPDGDGNYCTGNDICTGPGVCSGGTCLVGSSCTCADYRCGTLPNGQCGCVQQ